VAQPARVPEDVAGGVSIMPMSYSTTKPIKAPGGIRQELAALSVAAFLLLTLATGCGEQDPRLQGLFSRQIKQSDLPSGWFVDGVGVDDRDRPDEGILARWIQFRGVQESVFPTVLVIHKLIDYPDVDQARGAYAQAVLDEFPVEDWTWPEQVQVKSKADEFRLACLKRNLEIHGDIDERYRGSYFCTAVGRYDTTVSIIYANVFRERWLTFADLQHLIEAADARLAAGQP
jgi:hypothetical protein